MITNHRIKVTEAPQPKFYPREPESLPSGTPIVFVYGGPEFMQYGCPGTILASFIKCLQTKQKRPCETNDDREGGAVWHLGQL